MAPPSQRVPVTSQANSVVTPHHGNKGLASCPKCYELGLLITSALRRQQLKQAIGAVHIKRLGFFELEG